MASFYKILICLFLSGFFYATPALSQELSVARKWNEALLKAIRSDFARPTIHARNLFHASIALYDAWAVYDDTASTYFLNHSFRHFHCSFNGIPKPSNIKAAQEEAMSYAVYRLLIHRFRASPNASHTFREFNKLMKELGYDRHFTSTDYANGSAAALGNYIGEKLIEFGLGDGSNELHKYDNNFYTSVNPVLSPFMRGNPTIIDPNRWQSLRFPQFIDQSGNVTGDGPPPFLSPEWGQVVPFALSKEALNIYEKGGNKYWVYHDPGPPPILFKDGSGSSGEYQWNFSLVSIWASHHDPADSVLIDISPASTGNIKHYPSTPEEYKAFYELKNGGDSGEGYAQNPATGKPYEPQWVFRGDYTRVLAEFWADGPDSETPPGHWFNILNYVNDRLGPEKKWGGRNRIGDALEWDVKAYLTLGGAVHDAAIAAWGIKGYYDYVRPISAIRYMADLGQSSDPGLPRYHPAGIPLVEGFIELVMEGDSLAMINGDNNIGKIKLYTWRGPDYIDRTGEKRAGVGWILAENWWTYQQRTFVTPPFAGYVSGHSTFSRAAAEVLSLLTGDEYFPGGMSEFRVYKTFLEFEKGPSTPLVLQWAKYKDAADQCSLSRIWGGIHPPADDIPGRIIGQKIGEAAFHFAAPYFQGLVPAEAAPEKSWKLNLFPNPIVSGKPFWVKPDPFALEGILRLSNMHGKVIFEKVLRNNMEEVIEINTGLLSSGIYMISIERAEGIMSGKIMVQ